MSAPASFVYAPAEVRELDRIAIEELGIPGFELMNRAGRLTFEVARQDYPGAQRWLVLCGAGNNAGDGYVVASRAMGAGVAVTVAALTDPHRLGGDAARAWRAYQQAGGTVTQFSAGLCGETDLVIDALLGTGLTRPLEGAWLQAVEAVNACRAPVIAVDVPTGLDARTGHVLGAAVAADVTVTFIGHKLGLFLGAGPDHTGRIEFRDLGVALDRAAHVAPRLRLFDETDRRRLLPRRARSAHKGNFGHVLVVGGNHGMGGAVRLAGEAALRSGAGLVSIATRPQNVAAVIAGRPELMCRGVDAVAGLDPLIDRASVIAVGPGLGQDEWARALMTRVLGCTQPVVADADALNILAEQPRRLPGWVLTPHPGEAARLLSLSSAQVQADRLAAASGLWSRYGAIALLKGRGTLVGRDGDMPYLIDAGNPGMATAGMGDVLTGLVAGLIAQHDRAQALGATACAAYIHARAGDACAEAGERGLVAGDLLGRLRSWLNPAP